MLPKKVSKILQRSFSKNSAQVWHKISFKTNVKTLFADSLTEMEKILWTDFNQKFQNKSEKFCWFTLRSE